MLYRHFTTEVPKCLAPEVPPECRRVEVRQFKKPGTKVWFTLYSRLFPPAWGERHDYMTYEPTSGAAYGFRYPYAFTNPDGSVEGWDIELPLDEIAADSKLAWLIWLVDEVLSPMTTV